MMVAAVVQRRDRKPMPLLHRMQQLLGEKASTTDSTFLRELFLQQLPANVRMVLASTAVATSLDQLATLADRIMEQLPLLQSLVWKRHNLV